MDNIENLDQAIDHSIATLNGLLQKAQSTVEDKKLVFVHLRLLFQLASYLGYQLDITVPKYCSTCEGDRVGPQAEVPVNCGGGCFTCGPACFVNKYCRDMQPKAVPCVVCGQFIPIEEVAQMVHWASNPN